MSSLRYFVSKSLRCCGNFSPKSLSFRPCNDHVRASKRVDMINVRPLFAYVNRENQTKANVLASNSVIDLGFYRPKNPHCSFSHTLSNSHLGRAVPLLSASPLSRNYSFFSSSSSGNAAKSEDQGVPAASGGNEVSVSDSSVGNEWLDKGKDLWQSTVDALAYTGQKAKEASVELSPQVQQFLDSHPYLNNVVVPVGLTFTGTLLAWFVMPRILRRFHKYGSQGQAALLSGTVYGAEVPYEKSFWGSLEDPVRYLFTFMAFTQIGVMVAPATIASQYLAQAWRGAVILSFVWFLHRWKTNVFSRALAASGMVGLDREKLLALDKVSSVGLFVIGIMAFAEACGVAVQSILTVGGIGGVATAFAARDVLGNVLSGLSMQFSKPFSIGDTIKAGSIEGQVVEMGLTTTQLLSAEKYPVIVPNSLFSSQVIVNKSRAEWRAIINKIPIQINDVDKIPQISNDINNMLKSHAKVFLGKEPPYCFLSRIDSYFAEITLGCNLKHMRKDELYLTEQDILLRSVQIIKQHGAKLGSTYQDMTNQ